MFAPNASNRLAMLLKVPKTEPLPAALVRHLTRYDEVTTTTTARHNNNNNGNRWTGVISNAEKVVGYPTSFLNLRWLLNDEFANIAVHMKKLIGTNHPLLKTARNLLFQDEGPCYGLIVLLVAKMCGLNANFPDIDYDKSTGILHSQRVLAEVTEMVKMSNLIHKVVLNVDCETSTTTAESDPLHFGNKIALLTGDYLLSNAFRDLANIRNQEVNEIVSTAQRDLVEAEFVGDRDAQNRPIPCKPKAIADGDDGDLFLDQFDDEPYDYTRALGNAKSEWTIRTLLGGGSLLAKSCASALKLAGHDKRACDDGHLIGKWLALAVRARQDRDVILNASGEFSLINAPLMFHLQREPTFHETVTTEELDYRRLRAAIKGGSGIAATDALIAEIVAKACDVIRRFPQNGARDALTSIAEALIVKEKV